MDWIGQQVGSYRILAKIGEGAMGAVYLAEHPLLGKRAAVKVLHAELSSRREIVRRFFTEARATTRLDHPGVVKTLDFGHLIDGSAYLLLEFLDGENVAERLRREGRLSVGLTLEIGRQVAGALEAAHANRIVHRDLKPDNIFLVAARELRAGVRAKVLDFGVAKLVEEAGNDVDWRTMTGAMMGTPVYMSPEQCRSARNVDHRTDIYALGCVLFKMVSGEPPYPGKSLGDVIAGHLKAPIPSLAELAGAPLDDVLRRALAKQPEDRFTDMAEMRVALEAVMTKRRFTGPYVVPPRKLDAPRPTGQDRTEVDPYGATVNDRARKRHGWWIAAAAALALGALGGGGYLYLARHVARPPISHRR